MAGSRWPRMIFVAAVTSWLVFPIVQRSMVAEDGLAYVTAGQLFRSHPDAAYVHRTSNTSWRYDPRFQVTACRLAPKGTDCPKVTVPFLSAPPSIPIVVALGVFGGALGSLVTRYMGVGALVVGMGLLWRRHGRDPALERSLTAAALFMTPFAYEMSLFGQTSGLIFLAACIGLPLESERRKTTWAAVLWAATIAFKVFPLALIAVVAVRRRWRLLLITCGLLVVLSLAAAVMAPLSIHQFLAQLRPTTATQVSNADNASIDAVIRLIAPGWNAAAAAFVPFVALRAAIVILLARFALRQADDDRTWLYGWAAVLFVEPIVWWHYVGVIVVLAVLTARQRPKLAGGVVVAAAVLVPLALPLSPGLVAALATACVVSSLVVAAGVGTPPNHRERSVRPLDQPINNSGPRP